VKYASYFFSTVRKSRQKGPSLAQKLATYLRDMRKDYSSGTPYGRSFGLVLRIIYPYHYNMGVFMEG
jgi:hypothetical protein